MPLFLLCCVKMKIVIKSVTGSFRCGYSQQRVYLLQHRWIKIFTRSILMNIIIIENMKQSEC